MDWLPSPPKLGMDGWPVHSKQIRHGLVDQAKPMKPLSELFEGEAGQGGRVQNLGGGLLTCKEINLVVVTFYLAVQGRNF